MAEYGIAEVARRSGTTSRALRHYGDTGLLHPSRVGANGYRYYDDAGLVRLQRILLLRQLGLRLDAIASVLDAEDDARALRSHLDWLRAEADRLARQIASVERTITRIGKGEPLVAEETFDGFDNSQYREEVEARWGAEAWAQGDRWWRGLGPDGQQAFMAEHVAIAERWAQLRAAGEPADGAAARENARRHHQWIAAGWQGRQPDADELAGLAEMYVADERFAANYGGAQGAAYVRDALVHYALAELA